MMLRYIKITILLLILSPVMVFSQNEWEDYFDKKEILEPLDPIEGIWTKIQKTTKTYPNYPSWNSVITEDQKKTYGLYREKTDANSFHAEGIYHNGHYYFDLTNIGGVYRLTVHYGDNHVNATALLKDGLLNFSYEVPYATIKKWYSNSWGSNHYRMSIKYDITLLKIYPIDGVNDRSAFKNPIEWNGNGSGLIISKQGHIATNHHVVDEASEIEVEFKYNDEIRSFKAKVVQVDEENDLAILKINDSEFINLSSITYNFKKESSDVGTKVYAFGYPMALSIMGKEIKVTDGIISSKTGYKGKVATYQTTTPLQAGNSGGPLFDDKGNFIGINSAILKSKENVSYTIKSSYLLNLIDVLPEKIPLPSGNQLSSKSLIDQIKILTKYVVLVKVK